MIRRFAASTLPEGFYLSSDSNILHIARGGQVDERPLINQLPPCRDWQRDSARCLHQLRERFIHSLSDFGTDKPELASLVRHSRVTEEDLVTEERRWRSTWAAFVPRELSDTDAFEPVAFTRVPLGLYSSELERRSCAIAEECINRTSEENPDPQCNEAAVYQSLVLRDVGKIDGVERVLFSFSPLKHWSTTLLLSDAIHYFLKDIAELKYGKEMDWLNFLDKQAGQQIELYVKSVIRSWSCTIRTD